MAVASMMISLYPAPNTQAEISIRLTMTLLHHRAVEGTPLEFTFLNHCGPVP